MKPFEPVKYVRLNSNDIVEGVWTTDAATWETLKSTPAGDNLTLVLNSERVSPGDKLDMRSRRVSKKEVRLAAPPEPKLTFEQKRAAAYPPLNEFAEALTEKELGDDTKWLHYLKTVRKVRATIRKP
jgi:hypothetical protein